ncbi:hypothetical protein ACIOWE_10535 [Pseudomonas sp. NPDC087598]|uniref:hypothetical protein n=1 Tax=Pseudomonas sp. NPDC087598 TaxID=3364440 RepID=UPI0037F63376
MAKKLIELLIADDDYGNGINKARIRNLFVENLGATGEIVPTFSDNIVDYHIHLLETAGYVKVTTVPSNRGYDKIEVTWSGHDYVGQ